MEWRQHALIRLLERNISRNDIARVIERGEIIEEYQAGQGLPSCLIYGNLDKEAYHVVVAWDHTEREVYVITVYKLDLDHFEEDLRTRRDR